VVLKGKRGKGKVTEGGRRRRDEGRRETRDRRQKREDGSQTHELGEMKSKQEMGGGSRRWETGGRIMETREGIRGAKTGVEISAFSYSAK
jgi:hypothetical protein